MKLRVTVLENTTSTQYLVDKVIETKKSPRTVVQEYLKKYPRVYQISAQEETPYRKYGYSISSNPNAA